MSQLSEMIKKFKLADLVLLLLAGDPFASKRAKYVRAVKARATKEGIEISAEAATLAVAETANCIKRDLVG